MLSAQGLLPSSERPLLFYPWTIIRTRVYVDGFNLYYGALKGTQFKWLNLVELTRHVLPTFHTIDKLIYFTARVSGVSDRGAPRRQQVYLNALNTLPEVEVHFGSFLAKTAWRPLINLPVADKKINAPNTIGRGLILFCGEKSGLAVLLAFYRANSDRLDRATVTDHSMMP